MIMLRMMMFSIESAILGYSPFSDTQIGGFTNSIGFEAQRYGSADLGSMGQNLPYHIVFFRSSFISWQVNQWRV